MNKATIALLCCSALITACDNTNDTAKEEAGMFDKASSLANDAANAAKEATGNAVDNAKDAAMDSTTAAVDSVKESMTGAVDGAIDAGKEMASSVVDKVTAKSDDLMASASGAVSKLAPSSVSGAGEATYKSKCTACHAAGVAGSPKLGDKAAWVSRIAQGSAVMTQHAIEGFKGETGYMPPKGGFMSLSDADVSAAVDYMVSKSQ